MLILKIFNYNSIFMRKQVFEYTNKRKIYAEKYAESELSLMQNAKIKFKKVKFDDYCKNCNCIYYNIDKYKGSFFTKNICTICQAEIVNYNNKEIYYLSFEEFSAGRLYKNIYGYYVLIDGKYVIFINEEFIRLLDVKIYFFFCGTAFYLEKKINFEIVFSYREHFPYSSNLVVRTQSDMKEYIMENKDLLSFFDLFSEVVLYYKNNILFVVDKGKLVNLEDADYVYNDDEHSSLPFKK